LIKVKVVFIGIIAEAIGTHIEEYSIQENTRLNELLDVIAEKHPFLQEILRNIPLINTYVNGRHVDLNHVLEDNDEVIIAPPFYEGG